MEEIIKTKQRSPKEIIIKGIRSLNISPVDAMYTVCCYILSSCTLAVGMSPFSLGAYIAAFSSGKWLLFAFSAVLGIIRFMSGVNAITYILAIIASSIIMGSTKQDFKKRAVLVSAVLMIILFVRNLFSGALWYDYCISALEGVGCFVSAFVLRSSIPLFFDARERRCIPDTEIFCLLLFMAMAVRCTVGYPPLWGMDVSVILAIFILFAVNTEVTPANGCAMGALFGFAVYNGTVDISASVGMFAVCSMSSAILNRLGRWGVVLGFMLANVVFTAFFENVSGSFDIFEIIAAGVMFALVPRAVTYYIQMINSKTVRMATKAFIEQDKLQSVMEKRLITLSDSFASLSHSYEECFKNDTMTKNYIVRMFDTASGNICPDCGLKYNCWERSYKDTYKAMFEMLETAEKKGTVTIADVPEYLSSKCIKLKDFLTQFERMLDIYKVEKMWQQKLNDSRKLVAGQLRAISRSVANTAREFDMCVDTAAEKVLKAELDKQKIPFKNVVFLKGSADSFSVEILMERWAHTRKEETDVERIVESVTGKSTTMTSVINTGDGVSVTLRDSFRYKASIGTASLPKDGENVSGDSFVVCRGAGDAVAAAISDGMGTGKEAATESSTATELFSNFLCAGIDTETALELINSSLLLRSSGDSFATMDVCKVDLSSGSILVSKNGAATGYIKNGTEIISVESDSLPFGVLPHYGKISTRIFPVNGNAMVLMMSDGVADVFTMNDICPADDIIDTDKNDNPQLMASAILQKALDLNGGKASDDMTVVVVSVWEK